MIYPQCEARVSDPSSSQPCRIGHVGKCSNSLRGRDRIRMKHLCREAVDCSADSNGVDSVDSVWFCYLSLTPFSSTWWMPSLSLILWTLIPLSRRRKIINPSPQRGNSRIILINDGPARHHKCHWNRGHSVHSFAFFDKLCFLTRAI